MEALRIFVFLVFHVVSKKHWKSICIIIIWPGCIWDFFSFNLKIKKFVQREVGEFSLSFPESHESLMT